MNLSNLKFFLRQYVAIVLGIQLLDLHDAVRGDIKTFLLILI